MTQRYPFVELQAAYFAAEEEDRWRRIVKAGGGKWCGIQYGSPKGTIILFQPAPGESTISLYASALTVQNVELSIRNYREKQKVVKVNQ